MMARPSLSLILDLLRTTIAGDPSSTLVDGTGANIGAERAVAGADDGGARGSTSPMPRLLTLTVESGGAHGAGGQRSSIPPGRGSFGFTSLFEVSSAWAWGFTVFLGDVTIHALRRGVFSAMVLLVSCWSLVSVLLVELIGVLPAASRPKQFAFRPLTPTT